jgi:hypothetical protein
LLTFQTLEHLHLEGRQHCNVCRGVAHRTGFVVPQSARRGSGAARGDPSGGLRDTALHEQVFDQQQELARGGREIDDKTHQEMRQQATGGEIGKS